MSVPLLEGMHLTGWLVALLLPWLSGSLLVAAVVPRAPWPLVLGHGYLAGQLAAILSLLAIDAVGLSMSFAVPAVLLAILAAIGGLAWWRQGGRPTPPRLDRSSLWHLLWFVPLALFVAERGGVMVQELALRPLFAWDAWMNWVPRAVVWFHYETLTPFVAPNEWLLRSSDDLVYTLGNRRASEYPPGVPLLLLWQMLGAGTSDHTLLYLPWLLLPAAVAMALWGHLRLGGTPASLAALAVYALLSLPLLDIHAVLVGYADLWLAAAFGLGAMAISANSGVRHSRYLVLAGLAAAACISFKTPGLAFSAILITGVLASVSGVSPQWRSWCGMSLVGITLAVLIAGWLLPAGWPIDGLKLTLPGALPELVFKVQPLLPYLVETALLDANWHLLWPLFLVTIAVSAVVGRGQAFSELGTLSLLAGIAFLITIFGLTQYFWQVKSAVTFNRAVLYLVPLMIFVTFQRIGQCLDANSSDGSAR